MKPLLLSLPRGSVVTGEILRDYSQAVERLSQDILQVVLPTGLTIDVAWTPRFDPSGRFVVSLFGDDWEDVVIPPVEMKSPYDVASFVEQLASEYSRSSQSVEFRTVSDTDDIEIETGDWGFRSGFALAGAV